MTQAKQKKLATLSGQHLAALDKHAELQTQIETTLTQLRQLQQQSRDNRTLATALQSEIDALTSDKPK